MSDDEDYCPSKKKRRPRNKTVVNKPTQGVKIDFETLIKKFVDLETVRYEKFAEIWRDMKLSMIQCGRQNKQETREFLEDVFDIAISYYLPPYNFQVRSCGLYLMYGLYNTQYCIPPVKFRVTMDMWKDITDYQKEAHSQQHYDIDYVFQYLKSSNAFNFVHNRKELRLKAGTSVGLSNCTLPELGDIDTTTLRSMISSDDMRQLTAVDYQYQQLKIALAGPNATKPDVSLAVIQDNLIESINVTIQQHEDKLSKIIKKANAQNDQSTSEDKSQSTQDEEEETTGSRRAKIKAKAFSGGNKQSKRGRRKSANQLTEMKEKTSSNNDDDTANMVPIGVVMSSDDSEVREKKIGISDADSALNTNNTSTTEYISMPSLIDSPIKIEKT